jgi:hypothetical protein
MLAAWQRIVNHASAPHALGGAKCWIAANTVIIRSSLEYSRMTPTNVTPPVRSDGQKKKAAVSSHLH